MSTPIIFCADPLDAHAVDPAYAPERDAALALGLDTALLDFEALLHDTPLRAAYRDQQRAARMAAQFAKSAHDLLMECFE